MKSMSSVTPRSDSFVSPSESRVLGKSLNIRAYYQMTKPTISLLVVITVIPCLMMASRGLPNIALSFYALLGTFLASASAGMFNHLVDSDIDGYMQRTRARPIPSGRVSRPLAFSIASVLALASFSLLYLKTSPLAAWIALAANVFYVVVYTMYLKRRTVQNIVIGGAAGAVGPLIGWSAVTGELAWPAWMLFLVIFLWTPPHFWALAIKYKDDYAAANVPMLPSVKGVAVTRRQIFFYTLTLLPAVSSLYFGGQAGWFYFVFSGLLTSYFVYLAYRLWESRDDSRAMPLFLYSCFYLFGVFGALAIDRWLSFLL